MRALTLALMATPLFLVGCATNDLTMTYYSDPPGATITGADGRSFGRTPVSLTYPLPEQQRRQGTFRMQGVKAQWVSGATQSYSYIDAPLSYGLNQTFTFKRPPNAPGLSTDMNYALELEKLTEMRRQTAAQQDAAWAAERSAKAAAEASERAAKRAKRGLTCMEVGTLITCD